jgi:hypothetical protein
MYWLLHCLSTASLINYFTSVGFARPLDRKDGHMPKQGETTRCYKTGCAGTMTFHEKLNIDPETNPSVQPSGSIGGRPDWHYAGWLCDSCGEVFWDSPSDRPPKSK